MFCDSHCKQGQENKCKHTFLSLQQYLILEALFTGVCWFGALALFPL